MGGVTTISHGVIADESTLTKSGNVMSVKDSGVSASKLNFVAVQGATETLTEDTSTYSINSPADWTEKQTYNIAVPDKSFIKGVSITYDYQRTNSAAANFSIGLGLKIVDSNGFSNGANGVTVQTNSYKVAGTHALSGNDGSFQTNTVYVPLDDSVRGINTGGETRSLSLAMAQDSNLSSGETLSIKNINIVVYYMNYE